MRIHGIIETKKRVRHKGDECWGTAEAWTNRFRVRIAEAALKDENVYVEVLLHELIHLWLFVSLAQTGIHVSDRRQHRLIERLVTAAFRELRKYTRLRRVYE